MLPQVQIILVSTVNGRVYGLVHGHLQSFWKVLISKSPLALNCLKAVKTLRKGQHSKIEANRCSGPRKGKGALISSKIADWGSKACKQVPASLHAKFVKL